MADSERAAKRPKLAKKLPHIPTYSGPTKEEVATGRRQHMSAGQYTFYNDPLMVVEGAMQYVFDDKGRRYLDAYSNVCHLGHCHPHVVESVQKTMATVLTNTRYLHPKIVEYAGKLKSHMPAELDTCFFVNSGSEANDLAARLARVYTGHQGLVVLQNAYHGTTATCTGMSTCLAPGDSGGCRDYDYCSRDIHVAPVPDLLRGAYKKGDKEAGPKYAALVAETIDSKCKDNLAAFVHESIQGVGGQMVYPTGYLKEAYRQVRERGGVCIADEVQVGFGRTGSHFWGFESQGVVPDIVTMGKPIGNGFPLAAVVCKSELAKAFDDCQYFNTAGGNPVSCAAGLAVLEAIDRDGLQENARIQGLALLQGLQGLQKKHPLIGDVRGLGLFLGIELNHPGSIDPAGKAAAWVFERCKELGVLVGKGGPHGNVLRIKPPMCINSDDVELFISVVDRALGECEEGVQSHIVPSEKEPNDVNPMVYQYLKQQGFDAIADDFKSAVGGVPGKAACKTELTTTLANKLDQSTPTFDYEGATVPHHTEVAASSPPQPQSAKAVKQGKKKKNKKEKRPRQEE